jgi:hypothetical protein
MATKGLTALTPEMVWNQTAMVLPPVTSVVFFKAKLFWENVGDLEEYVSYRVVKQMMMVTVEKAKGKNRDRSKWKEVISAYSKGKRS